MKCRELMTIKELVPDERDGILIDLCIKFMKKVESFDDIGIEYINETDRFEFTSIILSIVRTYLISIREYYSNDQKLIDAIINDLQISLSPLFKIIPSGSSPKLLFSVTNIVPENMDRKREIYNILAPFISFVETNIYNCFVESYNSITSKLHNGFCELTAKASGILKEKKEETLKLPEIPGEQPEEKIKIKRKTK